ncbi:sulfurtransferase TusA family protein [Anianabacter salinae]|uniref:sulfurtransferase TusA family protein n=1 Tax=Anianabacter salinae TaxID=2851023 RepID=UPI00225DF6C5|nr:sulfurtransferase TusA family protein [Anianabacter salinae]MBV0912374.1 sulfurtransferase TusA family protein [Anianabacter salinae]
MDWDDDVDARDMLCPLPVLKARKRLAALAPGAVLRIVTTDPVAVIDLPHFCSEAGHEVLSSDADGTATAWLIRKALA